MKIYIGERQSGKTTKLVNWVLDGRLLRKDYLTKRLLVVPSISIAQYIKNKYKLKDDEICTIQEVNKRVRGTSEKYEIVIDELEPCLKSIFPVEVKEITINEYNNILFIKGK